MRHKDAEGYVTNSLLPVLHTDHKYGQTEPLLGAGTPLVQPWIDQASHNPGLPV